MLFAVGGTMLLWAYFYGLSSAEDYFTIQQGLDYVFAFVAFYLIGYGLWMIISAGSGPQAKV